jgi:serine protease
MLYLIPGYDFISDTARANDGDGRDADPTDPGDAIKQGECGGGQPPRDYPNSWHGTHVAGTIGVVKTDNNLGVAGINWQVKVQALRVLGKCGGTTSDINDAIRWAAGLPVPGVPNNPSPAKVINMSLGGAMPCFLSPATQQAINDAFNKGVTVVVAAGNDGKDAANYNPAGCDNVITVAASDPQGKLTPFSNYGDTVEILAPGGLHERCSKPEDGILSTVGSDTSGACAVEGHYAFYNGTSMAAPHVAGVAALWLAQDPSLTPKTLLGELQKAARPRNSSQCPKPCGAGLLSAVRGVPTPPAGIQVSLLFSPDKSSYQLGETVTVRASIKSAGTPQAGKTVQFSSADSAVASVTPDSAITDAMGEAQATVKANAAGETTITAQANGAKAEKRLTVQQPAPVPDLSQFGLLVLLAAIVALEILRRRVATG